jgi:hypothetical protein
MQRREGAYLFSNRRKEKENKTKKNHREEKSCGEGREFTFLLSLLDLG